jgi:hypothetical protein
MWVMTWQADNARLIIVFQLIQETRVYYVDDDVAGG